MKNREQIVKKITDLEQEIKYHQNCMETYSFEKTQSELDSSEMYQNYRQKKLEAIKNIELLRTQLKKSAK